MVQNMKYIASRITPMTVDTIAHILKALKQIK